MELGRHSHLLKIPEGYQGTLGVATSWVIPEARARVMGILAHTKEKFPAAKMVAPRWKSFLPVYVWGGNPLPNQEAISEVSATLKGQTQ